MEVVKRTPTRPVLINLSHNLEDYLVTDRDLTSVVVTDRDLTRAVVTDCDLTGRLVVMDRDLGA